MLQGIVVVSDGRSTQYSAETFEKVRDPRRQGSGADLHRGGRRGTPADQHPHHRPAGARPGPARRQVPGPRGGRRRGQARQRRRGGPGLLQAEDRPQEGQAGASDGSARASSIQQGTPPHAPGRVPDRGGPIAAGAAQARIARQAGVAGRRMEVRRPRGQGQARGLPGQRARQRPGHRQHRQEAAARPAVRQRPDARLPVRRAPCSSARWTGAGPS